MSTAARKPRVVKPKAGKKDAPVEAAPAPVPAPAPAAAPAPVPAPAPVAAPAPAEAAPAAAPEVPEKEPIIITPTSRLIANLNVQGINALLKSKHSELDDKIKDYEHAKEVLAAGKLTDTREVEKTENGVTTKVKESFERPLTAEETASFKKTVEQYSHSISAMEADRHAYGAACLRFAKNTPVAVAVVFDEVVKQSINHAMAAGQKENPPRKNIDIDYMYSDGLEKLPLAPLFIDLPTYVETRDQLTQRRRTEAEQLARTVLLKNQEKELRRMYKITKKMVNEATAKAEAAKAAAPAAAAPVEEPDPVEEEVIDNEAHLPVDRKTSFNHYAGLLCKSVSAKNYPGKKMRATGKLIAHLAKLLSELCQRLCTLLAESVKYDASKTVKVETVLFVLKLLLVDGHKPVETVELRNVDVPNPEILKKEQEKKDAEKAAGRSYKIDMSKIPSVIGRQAVHTITYPTSAYEPLEKLIIAKLAESDAEAAAKKNGAAEVAEAAK